MPDGGGAAGSAVNVFVFAMRTTVTIDADVELMLKKAMRERDKPFKQVLNDAVRDGLRLARAKPAAPFKQMTFGMGKPLVDLNKAAALVAELEDQALIARLKPPARVQPSRRSATAGRN